MWQNALCVSQAPRCVFDTSSVHDFRARSYTPIGGCIEHAVVAVSDIARLTRLTHSRHPWTRLTMRLRTHDAAVHTCAMRGGRSSCAVGTHPCTETAAQPLVGARMRGGSSAPPLPWMTVAVVSHHHHTRATAAAPTYLLRPSRPRFAVLSAAWLLCARLYNSS